MAEAMQVVLEYMYQLLKRRGKLMGELRPDHRARAVHQSVAFAEGQGLMQLRKRVTRSGIFLFTEELFK
jgi:hypothetical protein